MRESGSLELESALDSTAPLPLPKEAEKAATMPVEPLRTQTVLQEGMLGRKHDLEGSASLPPAFRTDGTGSSIFHVLIGPCVSIPGGASALEPGHGEGRPDPCGGGGCGALGGQGSHPALFRRP